MNLFGYQPQSMSFNLTKSVSSRRSSSMETGCEEEDNGTDNALSGIWV